MTILSGKKYIAQTGSKSEGCIHTFILDFIIPVSEYSRIHHCDRISCDGSTFVKSTVWLYCERSEADYHDFDVDGIISVVPDKRRCHISSLVDLYDHRRRTGKCGVYGDPIDLSDYWIIINDIYNDAE